MSHTDTMYVAWHTQTQWHVLYVRSSDGTNAVDNMQGYSTIIPPVETSCKFTTVKRYQTHQKVMMMTMMTFDDDEDYDGDANDDEDADDDDE